MSITRLTEYNPLNGVEQPYYLLDLSQNVTQGTSTDEIMKQIDKAHRYLPIWHVLRYFFGYYPVAEDISEAVLAGMALLTRSEDFKNDNFHLDLRGLTLDMNEKNKRHLIAIFQNRRVTELSLADGEFHHLIEKHVLNHPVRIFETGINTACLSSLNLERVHIKGLYPRHFLSIIPACADKVRFSFNKMTFEHRETLGAALHAIAGRKTTFRVDVGYWDVSEFWPCLVQILLNQVSDGQIMPNFDFTSLNLPPVGIRAVAQALGDDSMRGIASVRLAGNDMRDPETRKCLIGRVAKKCLFWFKPWGIQIDDESLRQEMTDAACQRNEDSILEMQEEWKKIEDMDEEDNDDDATNSVASDLSEMSSVMSDGAFEEWRKNLLIPAHTADNPQNERNEQQEESNDGVATEREDSLFSSKKSVRSSSALNLH